MHFDKFSFGALEIDGNTYEHLCRSRKRYRGSAAGL